MARRQAGPRRHRLAYNLTMDPFEKYDMTFNGAVSTRFRPHRRAAMPAMTTAG